jgi:hypothetical protein
MCVSGASGSIEARTRVVVIAEASRSITTCGNANRRAT